MSLLSRWLPRSLVGRVFALYSVTLLLFVGGGLGLFYQFQFAVELEAAQNRAESLATVMLPTISDSAVIGDDDTIARTLERAIYHSNFASAAFIDLKGRHVQARRNEVPALDPPAWLTQLVAARLYDTNLPVAVGGRDYGVLRLRFAPELIASDLWRLARAALLLAALSLVGGLLLIRMPLMHWLGHLGRLRTLEQGLSSGQAAAHDAMADNAPIELRQTFRVLSQAAENLQAQREQAAVTLGAIGDAVLTLDAQGLVVLANPAAGSLFEQPADALLRQPAAALLPAAFKPAAGPAAHGPALQPWRGRRIELAGAGGRQRVLDTTLSPILGAGGVPVGHVLALRDISEQHALDQRLRNELATREGALKTLRAVLENLSARGVPAGPGSAQGRDDIEAISLLISGLVARLHERSEQLNAIFALSPDGFVSFDAARLVSYVNPAFLRLTGLREQAVLGQDETGFSELLTALCSDATRAQMPRMEALRRDQREGQHDGQDAGRRAVLHVQRPARRVLQMGLRSSQSELISQVFYLRDVTHETEVDRMKSEFLSTAAHELRTPMASIFGFSELLLHRQLTPARQREMLQVVHRQTQRMVTILNELLDLARIEARRGTDFVLETLDLAQLAQEVVADFQPPAGRSAPLLLALQPGIPVRVDRDKLHQALANVLSNAYKYSPDGGPVRLQLVAEAAADVVVDAAADGVAGLAAPAGPGTAPARWGLRVDDKGIGMTAEQLARVSERFYRADASGKIPGTGLGMSIVKEIIELLGGRLQLASQPGQGTQVTLWLPAMAAAAGTPTGPSGPSQWGLVELTDSV